MWELVGSAGELLEGLFAGVARAGKWLWEGAANLMSGTSAGKAISAFLNMFFLGDIAHKMFGKSSAGANGEGDLTTLFSSILNPVVLAALSCDDRGTLSDLSGWLRSYGQSLVRAKGTSRLTGTSILCCATYIEDTKLKTPMFSPQQALKVMSDIGQMSEGAAYTVGLTDDELKDMTKSIEKSYDNKDFSITLDFMVYCLDSIFRLAGSVGLHIDTQDLTRQRAVQHGVSSPNEAGMFDWFNFSK